MFGFDESVDRPAAPAGLRVAPLTRRVGGLLIDEVVIIVPIVVVALAFGFRPGDEISDAAVFNISAATIAVSFGYYLIMIGLWARTVGKFAVGTRVVQSADGERPGWGSAALRALVPLAFGAIPQIGFALAFGVYAMAVFSPLRQGLHDRAAATLVVLAVAPIPDA